MDGRYDAAMGSRKMGGAICMPCSKASAAGHGKRTAGLLAADSDDKVAMFGSPAPGALADGPADLEAIHTVPIGQVTRAFALIAVTIGEHIHTVALALPLHIVAHLQEIRPPLILAHITQTQDGHELPFSANLAPVALRKRCSHECSLSRAACVHLQSACRCHDQAHSMDPWQSCSG